jgi:hypothetical protein
LVNKCDLEKYSGRAKSSVMVDEEQCNTHINMRNATLECALLKMRPPPCTMTQIPIRILTPIVNVAILPSVELYAGCHGNRMSIVSP